MAKCCSECSTLADRIIDIAEAIGANKATILCAVIQVQAAVICELDSDEKIALTVDYVKSKLDLTIAEMLLAEAAEMQIQGSA